MENETDSSEEDYGSTKAGSYKDVILEQLRRILQLSACEYRGGFYSFVTDKKGNEREIYTPDTRSIYCNALYSLACLLLPKYDGDMNEKWKTFNSKVVEITKEFLDFTKRNESVVLGEARYDDPTEKLKLEEFKFKNLAAHQELFLELSQLLGRLNYLEISGGSY